MGLGFTLLCIGLGMLLGTAAYKAAKAWRQDKEDREIVRRLKALMPATVARVRAGNAEPQIKLYADFAHQNYQLTCLCPKGHLGYQLTTCEKLPVQPLTTGVTTKDGPLAAAFEDIPVGIEKAWQEYRFGELMTFQTMDSTTPPTPPSPPLDPPTTPSGPAELGSGCAHVWRPVPTFKPGTYQGGGQDQVLIYWHVESDQSFKMRVWCRECGVSKWSGKIVVPAVARTLSTSPKPASSESAQELIDAR